MPAYIIVTRLGPVRDAEAIAEYSRLNRENAVQFQELYHITPLVVYGTVEALEGPAPDGVIMLQFPSMADARALVRQPRLSEGAGLPAEGRGVSRDHRRRTLSPTNTWAMFKRN